MAHAHGYRLTLTHNESGETLDRTLGPVEAFRVADAIGPDAAALVLELIGRHREPAPVAIAVDADQADERAADLLYRATRHKLQADRARLAGDNYLERRHARMVQSLMDEARRIEEYELRVGRIEAVA